jgi:hypothetical protein
MKSVSTCWEEETRYARKKATCKSPQYVKVLCNVSFLFTSNSSFSVRLFKLFIFHLRTKGLSFINRPIALKRHMTIEESIVETTPRWEGDWEGTT